MKFTFTAKLNIILKYTQFTMFKYSEVNLNFPFVTFKKVAFYNTIQLTENEEQCF